MPTSKACHPRSTPQPRQRNMAIQRIVSLLLLSITLPQTKAKPLSGREVEGFAAFPQSNLLPRIVNPDDCRLWVDTTAWTTCASLTTQYGISVAQLFNLNPSVDFDCFGFQPGARYCLVAREFSVSSYVDFELSTNVCRPWDAVGKLPVSADGVCAARGNVTCVGSTFGDCCGKTGR